MSSTSDNDDPLQKAWVNLRSQLNPNSEQVFCVIHGIIILCCFLFGSTSNFISTIFFTRTATKCLFKEVFRAASLVDVMICVLSLCTSVSFLGGRYPIPPIFSDYIFCQIWGVLWASAIRSSVGIVSLASVFRVLNIWRPRCIRRKPMRTILCCFILAILVTQLLPSFIGETYTYNSAMGVCAPSFALTKLYDSGQSVLKKIISGYIPALSIILCFPVILICYFVNLWKLIKLRNPRLRRRGGRTHQIEAVITISSFMLTYLLTQAPVVLYFVSVRINLSRGKSLEETIGQPFNMPYISPGLFTLATCFNAIVNPGIYYFRLVEFRTFVRILVNELQQELQSKLLYTVGIVRSAIYSNTERMIYGNRQLPEDSIEDEVSISNRKQGGGDVELEMSLHLSNSQSVQAESRKKSIESAEVRNVLEDGTGSEELTDIEQDGDYVLNKPIQAERPILLSLDKAIDFSDDNYHERETVL